MKTKFFFFALIALVFAGCNTNEPVKWIQTYTENGITYTYYLYNADSDESNAGVFAQDDLLILHLDIRNNGQDTVMVHSYHLGTCYDANNQYVQSMSLYLMEDTVPTYKTTPPGGSSQFSSAFFVNVPSSGSYHYQNPTVMQYVKGKENDIKEYTIPLTIHFRVK